MQGICHLSRRWHQQFCRSPSFLDHRRCLQQWQTIRCYRQPTRSLKPSRPAPQDDDLVVREYEQVGDDPENLRRIDNPITEEEKDIRKQIKQLERESALLRRGPFAKDDEVLKLLPEEERKQLLSSLEAEISSLDFNEMLSDDGLDVDDVLEDAAEKPKRLTVTLRIPAKHKAYVKRFNDALQQAQDTPKDLEIRALWVWYLRCQQKVSGFSNFISEDVWDYLWQTQMQLNPRSRHIVILARDMEAAGISLEDDYLLGYMEALHATGETTTALELWESKKTDGSTPLNRIGVQLYAAVGRPSKAQEIAMTTNLDMEALVPVFQAWANSQKPNAPARLWSFYLQIKQKMSPQVEVLGQITSVLLKAGRQDMALAVFKDMLASKGNSTESVRTFQSLTGHESPDEDSINKIGLTALLSLPHSFNNKFFFGAWIKWLLGANKVNDAALVVELMQERGIRPDARHLNGIVGAWFREGTAASRERAEQMAWAMINARVRQVQQRGRTVSNSEAQMLEAHSADIKRLPRFLQRQVPPATIETFSILLLRYVRLGDYKKAEQVTQIMTGPAQIKPNSFILNHWLYLALRLSDVDGMWSRYQALQGDIKPDLETFVYLWDGQRRNLNLSRRSSKFPTPRQLYKEMAHWFDSLTAAKRDEARSQFSRELYEQIVRSFCLHSDLPCTFFVVQHLHETFGMLPHPEVSSMIVMQVARMMPGDPSIARPRRAARRRSDEIYRTALGNFASLMNEVYLRKVSAATERGLEVDLVTETETPVTEALRLEAIQTFICLIMLKQAKRGGYVDNDLIVASRALGIEGDKIRVKEQLEEALKLYSDGRNSEQ